MWCLVESRYRLLHHTSSVGFFFFFFFVHRLESESRIVVPSCCWFQSGTLLFYGTSSMTSPLTQNTSGHTGPLLATFPVIVCPFLNSCFPVKLPRTSCIRQEVQHAAASKHIVTTVNTVVAFIETSLSVYCCIIHSRLSSLSGPSIVSRLLADPYNLLCRVVVVFSTVWGCNTS